MVLFTALQILLGRLAGREDAMVGTPIAGHLAGLAARIDAAQEENVLLLTFHQIMFDGWSIGIFLRELSELYAAFRAELPSPLAAWVRTEAVAEAVTPHSGTSKFDLNLTLAETGLGLQGAFEYNLDLFAEPTVLRMRDHLIEVLAAVVADPEIRLLDVPLGARDSAEDGLAVQPAPSSLDEAESFAF